MRPTRALFLATFAAASLAAWAALHPLFGNVEAITAKRLEAHLEFIASDLLEGRDTPSRGLDLAAMYIASQLKLWGVKPAGDDGTYFQRVPIRPPVVNLPQSVLTIGDRTGEIGKDFLASPRPMSMAGGVVYVGGSLPPSREGVDGESGPDVRGKLVLAIASQPGALQSIGQAARASGAVGILLVPDPARLGAWGRDAQSLVDSTALPNRKEPNVGLPVATLSPSALEYLMQGESASASELLRRAADGVGGEAFALQPGKRVSARVVLASNGVSSQNVVGIVPGTGSGDPDHEYVALGAHYDHVGMQNGPGDRIFNGADDNGSGTVALLEIAHAFATGPRPRRSMLFVWHCGEERGLLGSSFFVENPTVPIKSIVAQLNLDMVGRSKQPDDKDPRNARLTGPDAIYLIGSRRLSTELHELSEQANRQLYGMKFDYWHDRPEDPENLYMRSDHYNYAQKGIPVIFYFDGIHRDYHQPSDEVAHIDFRKMERVSRTVYATAWTIGNHPHRPRLDRQP